MNKLTEQFNALKIIFESEDPYINMKVDLINLTPHEVNFVNKQGEEVLKIPPSGTIVRVEKEQVPIVDVEVEGNIFPYIKIHYTEVQEIPEEKENTLYIVSTLCAQYSDRNDLVILEDLVRDNDGRIIGAKSIAKLTNEKLNKVTHINLDESFPFSNPYMYFEVTYQELYGTYKKNPSMYNKGRMQQLIDIMNQLTGSRAKTIRNKIETEWASNKFK